MTRKFERMAEATGTTVAEELPSLMVHENLIVNRDLSLAGGWSIQLPNTMLAGASARADLLNVFRSVMNSLPPEYDWQFRWVQHNRRHELVDLLSKRPRPSGLAGEIVRETEAVTLSLLRDEHIAWKECHLFIVRRPKKIELDESAGAKRSGILKLFTGARVFAKSLLPGSAVKEAQVNEEVFLAIVRETEAFLRSVEPLLKGANLFPERLKADGLFVACYQWANKRRFIEGGLPPAYSGQVPFCEAYALNDWDMGPDSNGQSLPAGVYRMGDHFETILTLHLPPEHLTLGIWEPIVYGGINNFEMTCWATPQDKTKRIGKLNRLRNTVKKVTENDPAAKKQRDDIELELQELGSNQDRLWRMCCTIRVWGDTPQDVMQSVTGLQFLAESNGQIAVIHERKNPWVFLRATCPGWTQDVDPYRAIDVTTRQAVRLLPIHGQPTFLTSNPNLVGALFSTISSTGGLLNIDPHERSHYSAPHMMITAGTGAGKSVLISSLVLELLGGDGRAVMIDRGGSFDGIAAAMGTAPIRLTSATQGITLNPLFTQRGRLPDPDELGSILALLEVMIMSAAQREGRMTGEEMRTLRDALQRLYEERPGEERFLSDLRDRLASNSEGRNLALNLAVWCASGGDYGAMFDGPNNIPLGGRLTVIDLGQDTRGQNKALTNVLTMLLISIVSQLMAHNSVRRKYVIFDEAGVLMQNEAQAKFLDYAYRTFRKTGTGVAALTQKAMDLAPLFSYAPLKFFLRQDDLEDTKQACAIAHFDPEVVPSIAALESRIGEYSDFVVIQHMTSGQTQAHLCRNYSTPLKYAMFTSEKEDTTWMQEYAKAHKVGRDVAMREFAKLFPRGIAHKRNHPETR